MKAAATPPSFRLLVPVVDERYDDAGMGPVEPLAEELPLPSDLGDVKMLVVVGGPARPVGFFGRVFGQRRARGVHPAVRGAALLARGYTDVSGGSFGEHHDAVWGFTTPGRGR